MSRAFGGEIEIAQLFEPPDNTEFVGGLLVTHDLDGVVLADRVAALLCGATGEGAALRRRTRAARPSGVRRGSILHVLCAADRFRPGPLVPWTTVIPVTGRRLHAKFGLLEFRRPNRMSVVRAYVTSANLTHGGLGSNRELFAWSDLETNRHSHVAADLAEAAEQLLEDIVLSNEDHGGTAVAARQWLKRLRTRGGRLAGVRPTSVVAHSLSKPRLPLHRLLAKNGTPVDDLVIVSPGFAGSESVVKTGELSKIEEQARRIRLVVPLDRDRRPVFSPAAIERLSSRSGGFQLLGVPVDDNNGAFAGTPGPDSDELGGHVRRLHAKAIAVSRGRTATLLIGSANYTTPALSGRNRELVVAVECDSRMIERLLETLGTTSADPGDAMAPGPTEPSSEVVSVPHVDACFELPDDALPGASGWGGTLRLTWEHPPDEVSYRSAALDVIPVQQIELRTDDVWLAVSFGAVTRQIPIRIDEPFEGFWDAAGVLGDEDDVDRYFAGLLGDLGTARRGTSSTSGGKRRDKDAPASTRYRIPLDRRLPDVVALRMRAEGVLRDHLPTHALADTLERYLGGPEGSTSEAAIDVALSVLSDETGVEPRRTDELLDRLRDALPGFVSRHGAGSP